QVIGFAINQHPFETIFLVKQAQIYASIQNFDEALAALEKAELLEPSEGDIYLIRGTIYSSMGWFDDAEENLKKALHSADNKADVYYQLRSEEHTSELQSRENLVCRLLLEKK